MTSSRSGSADVAAVFEAGLSGYYPEPMLTVDQLLELSELCLRHNRIVDTIEAFSVTPDAEQLRPEFSLFGQEDEDRLRPWPERVEDSHSLVKSIVADARISGLRIEFKVWLDWE